MLAFVILDSPSNSTSASAGSGSVLDMQTVTLADGKVHYTKYLDNFPFPFYVVLQDISKLPSTLAGLMRQWFELKSF